MLSLNAYISKNVKGVESAIRHDEITIHPSKNFGNITDANITAINEESEINSIGKVTIFIDLIKECKSFLERVQKFNSNIEKRNQISQMMKLNFSKHVKMVNGKKERL